MAAHHHQPRRHDVLLPDRDDPCSRSWRPGKFGTKSNFEQLALNVSILTVVSVGTTFVIATAGIDLSIPSGIVLGEVFAVKALS